METIMRKNALLKWRCCKRDKNVRDQVVFLWLSLFMMYKEAGKGLVSTSNKATKAELQLYPFSLSLIISIPKNIHVVHQLYTQNLHF